ncbi:MAG: hypothetical protein HRU19_27000 [Pseudobacteriovorax sp.]|nr:hypothetical protein [Pseudobacteriovorax sp.]
MKSLLPLFLYILFIACGTKVGNPDQPTDHSSSAQLPSLDYSLDETDDLSLLNYDFHGGDNKASYMRQGSSRPVQMLVLMDRVNRIVRETKNILDTLTDEEVSGIGRHRRHGPSANLSVEITNLMDHPDFDFKAIICQGETLFMEIFWDESESNINFIHNFRTQSLSNQPSQNILSEVSIKERPDDTQIMLWSQGQPWVASDLETDGTILTEAVMAHTYSRNEFSLQAVKDWNTEVVEPDAMTNADEYLVGTMMPTATREFLEYRKDHPNCMGFDETLTQPGWCLGGTVSRKQPSQYSSDERDEAWIKRLSANGILSVSELKQPSFSSDERACLAMVE